MDSKRMSLPQILLAVGVGGVLLVFPFIFTLPFPQHIMIMIFVYASLAQGWNIPYTSSLLLIKFGVNPWIGMLAGAALAIGLSLLIGLPVFRLAGHYFAIATIAIGEIFQIGMVNWKGGGGANGLYLPLLDEGFLNLEFHNTKVPYYFIALGIAAVTFYAVYRME
ncbi:MAG: branched-chain amino acid ABC transporter permease, partial [Deltaproteobacteria bacterium]|nr:branched-chain amino acid ABC transporter permease [Deltaproteobacteria bacterium]